MNEFLHPFEIFGVPVLFTGVSRVYLPPTPPQLYRYDLRHGDDDSFPCTLEHRVLVNRWGTVYATVPLLSDEECARPIDEDDWAFCCEEDAPAITEFMRKQLIPNLYSEEAARIKCN